MTTFPEYDRLDALGLAALIRAGEVSAEPAREAAIERIEARDPALNAVVHKLYDKARAALAAGLPEGPFTGVPFLLKDLSNLMAGAPAEHGSHLFRGYVAETDSAMVRRYKRAGLSILGFASSAEFGLSITVETAATGITRNPWDRERSTGGSSGGSAAAVAARMVPAANASDGGGSIRIPASACGLFGLKPTRARTPSGEGWAGLACHHAVTRSVRDSAALLDATHGPVPGYPYAAPTPAGPFLAEVGKDPGRLRIAWSAANAPDVTIAPECRAALEAAVKLAAELGHEVEEAPPPVDHEVLRWAMMTIVSAETTEFLNEGHPLEDRTVRPDDVEPFTWLAAEMGRTVPATDYVKAVNGMREIGRRLGDFFERYDAFLSPTLAMLPPPIGVLDYRRGTEEGFLGDIKPYIAFTQMFNMSGQPAASLPLYWTDEGQPVGVQIAGRFGDEATVLRLSAQFEAARPWAERLPPDLPLP